MGLCSVNGVRQAAPTQESPDCIVEYRGPGPWYHCDQNAKSVPRLSKSGLASSAPMTVMDLLDQAEDRHGQHVALLAERSLRRSGSRRAVPSSLANEQWRSWTWSEYHCEVCQVAKAFIALGLLPRRCVNIWISNSPEWHISALATMHAGGIVAPIFPNDSVEAVAYKVVHSGGKIVVCDDRTKMQSLATALEERGDCKRVKAFVLSTTSSGAEENIHVEGRGPVPVLGWDSLLAMAGDVALDKELSLRLEVTTPGHCGACIYTSGTTGEPKAVMQSHDSLTFSATLLLNLLKQSGFGTTGAEERIFSYWPLAQVGGLLADLLLPLATTAVKNPTSTHFARLCDLQDSAFLERLVFVKPTLLWGPPLLWDSLADEIRKISARTGGNQLQVLEAARGVALEYAKNKQIGGSGAAPWGYTAAQTMVLSQIHSALGLDGCKFGLVSSGTLPCVLREFFGSFGFNLNEAYNLSECCGPCTFSTAEAYLWGSCGWETPGVEVKAFKCDPCNINKKKECPRAPDLDSQDELYQGELCIRGRTIMMGYMAGKDLGKKHLESVFSLNASTIDKDGWLHSGDKGYVTGHGLVKITGRYIEAIQGSDGTSISPNAMENLVKQHCIGISEVVMVGARREYKAALITLKTLGRGMGNGDGPACEELDEVARSVNPDVATSVEALDDGMWVDAITRAVEAANQSRKCCPSNSFAIRKFTLLPMSFSEQRGEVTPAKQLRRRVIEENFTSAIERLYKTDGVYVRYVGETPTSH